MKRNLDRYHRDIYLPPYFEKDIGDLLRKLNRRNWVWGFHAVKKLLSSMDKETSKDVVSFVYTCKITPDNVFEVYYSGLKIEKFCIRVPFDNQLDLILVVTKDKVVVTLYLNFNDHIHNNLDDTKYKKE